MGINKIGDLKMIYSPIIVQNSLASGSSSIIGNGSEKHTKPSLVCSDASEIGLVIAVVNYDNIPSGLAPEESLSARILADTCWASAKVKGWLSS